MIVVMQEGATEDQVEAVINRMVEMDFTIHRSTGMVHIVLGGVGPEERVNPADFEEMDGVQECRRIMSPAVSSSPAALLSGPAAMRLADRACGSVLG